jgi:hypothetical protein
MSDKKCLWCSGTGYIKLEKYITKVCFNCKGTGLGPDGGEKITAQKKPWNRKFYFEMIEGL